MCVLWVCMFMYVPIGVCLSCVCLVCFLSVYVSMGVCLVNVFECPWEYVCLVYMYVHSGMFVCLLGVHRNSA